MTGQALFVCLFIQVVALLEAIHTAAGVHKLLLARKERMALGANIYAKVLLGGGSLDGLTARAADRGRLVLGMDAVFHSCHLSDQTLYTTC